MSFTDQKPFTVEQLHIDARWVGKTSHERFRCAWCGHRFAVGDIARWVYTNSEPDVGLIGGNPFICAACDGPREVILSRLRALATEVRADRYWWVTR